MLLNTWTCPIIIFLSGWGFWSKSSRPFRSHFFVSKRSVKIDGKKQTNRKIVHSQCPPGFRWAECHLPSFRKAISNWERIRIVWDTGTPLLTCLIHVCIGVSRYTCSSEIFWNFLGLESCLAFGLGFNLDIPKLLRSSNHLRRGYGRNIWGMADLHNLPLRLLATAIWLWHNVGNFVSRTVFQGCRIWVARYKLKDWSLELCRWQLKLASTSRFPSKCLKPIDGKCWTIGIPNNKVKTCSSQKLAPTALSWEVSLKTCMHFWFQEVL